MTHVLLGDHIRQELRASAFHPEIPSKKFITRKRVNNILSRERLQAFISVGQSQLDAIWDDLLMTVSILFEIRWNSWDTFEHIFLNYCDDSNVNNRLDEDLPHSLQNLNEIIGQDYAAEFFRCQFEFCPITIEEGKEVTMTTERRFPFQNIVHTQIGRGGFGAVFEEVIAPGQFKTRENLVNETPMPIARKIMRDCPDTRLEIRNLLEFQQGLTEHKLVCGFKAIFTVGDEISILYEKADCDLEDFLGKDKSQFSAELPALLLAFANIADALEHIHRGLKTESSSEARPCCHRDLTPKNILVFLDSNSQELRWKISDLGISRIQASSLKGTVTNSTIRTTAHRGKGAYLAPEALKNPELKEVGRQSDIWSLGCILTRVLIHGLEGLEALRKLDFLRGTCADGTDYADDFFFREETTINPHIKDWLKRLPERSFKNCPDQSLRALRDLIFEMLDKNPKTRPCAREVSRRLSDIRSQVCVNSGSICLDNLTCQDAQRIKTEHVKVEEISLLAKYCTPSTPQVGNCDNRISKTFLSEFQRYIISKERGVFWVEEGASARDTLHWPTSTSIVYMAQKVGLPVLLHSCLRRNMGSSVNGPLNVLYSLICQLIRILSFNHAQQIQVNKETLASLNDNDESFPLAINLFSQLLSQLHNGFVLLLDDFESITRDNVEQSREILRVLKSRPTFPKEAVMIVITTSGYNHVMAEDISSFHVKIAQDLEKYTEESQRLLESAISNICLQ